MGDKLPRDIFLKSFANVPRIACNLLITNTQNQVLLAKRAIPPFENKWHFPGSFILKGELIEECLQRIFKNELGFKEIPPQGKFFGVFENLNSETRGHVIDLYYGYQLKNPHFEPQKENKEISFFDYIPSEIGFNHKSILEKFGYKT